MSLEPAVAATARLPRPGPGALRHRGSRDRPGHRREHGGGTDTGGAGQGEERVTSGAAWAGGATLAAYGATKAFDLILAESLWAEWRTRGRRTGARPRQDRHPVHAPGVRRRGQADLGELADPDDVAAAALDHLADGPTWIYGSDTPTGGSRSARSADATRSSR